MTTHSSLGLLFSLLKFFFLFFQFLLFLCFSFSMFLDCFPFFLFLKVITLVTHSARGSDSVQREYKTDKNMATVYVGVCFSFQSKEKNVHQDWKQYSVECCYRQPNTSHHNISHTKSLHHTFRELHGAVDHGFGLWVNLSMMFATCQDIESSRLVEFFFSLKGFNLECYVKIYKSQPPSVRTLHFSLRSCSGSFYNTRTITGYNHERQEKFPRGV